MTVKYEPLTDIKYLLNQHSAAESFPSLRKCLIRKLKHGTVISRGCQKWQKLILHGNKLNAKFSVFCTQNDADQSSQLHEEYRAVSTTF